MKWSIRVIAETTAPSGRTVRMDRVVEGIRNVGSAMLLALQARKDGGYPFVGEVVTGIEPFGERTAKLVETNPDTGAIVLLPWSGPAVSGVTGVADSLIGVHGREVVDAVVIVGLAKHGGFVWSLAVPKGKSPPYRPDSFVYETADQAIESAKGWAEVHGFMVVGVIQKASQGISSGGLDGWRDEFGEGFAVPLVIYQNLHDRSWHNDASPSFTVRPDDDGELPILWVDHPDPWKRETGGGRFVVTVPGLDDAIYDGDDPVAAVAALRGAS